MVIGLLALAAGLALPPQELEIADKVAGQGKPECTSYGTDGSVGPCLPWFRVGAGVHVNARSLGGKITFTQGATAQLTRDEFALLAGHEIAHFYLNHGASNPAVELAADRLGARLACAAGYDPVAGASLFQFLSAGSDHPHRAERRAAVLAVGCDRARSSRQTTRRSPAPA